MNGSRILISRLSSRLARAAAIAPLVAVLGLTSAAPARAAAELTCERIPVLLSRLLQKHILFHYVNDELRDRVVDSYLRRLDPSKTLLLRSEAKALEEKLRGVVLDLNERDCSILDEVQPDLLRRYKQMEGFVRKVVGDEDYEVDPGVTLVSDADKRGRPATEEERNQLLIKLIHFQMANYQIAELDPGEAKKKLVHRYELMTRRASELEASDIYAGFLDAFARALDPHSNYYSPETYEDFGIGMRLSLDGIGVALSSKDGYSVVEKVIPGGAADKLDELEREDKIVAVAQETGDWVDVIDMDLRDVVKLIRGKRGTIVRLKILRRNSEGTSRFEVAMQRQEIRLEEQAAKLSFETLERDGHSVKLATIELPSFYGDRNPTRRQSSRDIRRLLREVKKQGADGLLLDLSRNGGGLLEHAVEIAGLFIDEGGVVAVKDVYAKLQVLRDPDRSIAYSGPVVVLTSRVSASASEIVAGAMKDYSRALVVGDDHTFGKGTVQSLVELENGLGALKVTTQIFFRPGGASTQNDGVASDIRIPSPFNREDYSERHQPFALETQAIPPFLEKRWDPSPSFSLGAQAAPPWQAITREQIQAIAELSAERVSGSEEFQQILLDLAETKARGGVIHLSEILEESGKQQKATSDTSDEASGSEGPQGQDTEGEEAESAQAPSAAASDPHEPEENGPTLQQREALEILADLVVIVTRKEELASAG